MIIRIFQFVRMILFPGMPEIHIKCSLMIIASTQFPMKHQKVIHFCWKLLGKRHSIQVYWNRKLMPIKRIPSANQTREKESSHWRKCRQIFLNNKEKCWERVGCCVKHSFFLLNETEVFAPINKREICTYHFDCA